MASAVLLGWERAALAGETLLGREGLYPGVGDVAGARGMLLWGGRRCAGERDLPWA